MLGAPSMQDSEEDAEKVDARRQGLTAQSKYYETRKGMRCQQIANSPYTNTHWPLFLSGFFLRDLLATMMMYDKTGEIQRYT